VFAVHGIREHTELSMRRWAAGPPLR
jgi:hypothetical protein